jgi:alpha-glucosidase
MKTIASLLMLLFAQAVTLVPLQASEATLTMTPGESWWGGFVVDAPKMPYVSDTTLQRDLLGDCGGNQAQPLLISNKGRFLWNEQPFRYEIGKGVIHAISGYAPFETGQSGKTLREVHAEVTRRFFPPSGTMPDPLMFTLPQYNTWIELMYDQNQEDILRYARAIIKNGYPAGVLMIDDNWQRNYGDWGFSKERFSDPKAMMKELHELGFKVMVWVCPFVSPDSPNFRKLEKEGLLLREAPDRSLKTAKPAKERAAMVRWWNGVSGCLDLSHPKAQAWFRGQLTALVRDYGVDGFKLDAGDPEFYSGNIATHVPSLPNEQTRFFAEIGLTYPMNEYRACWKMAGQPLAQRLRDKEHLWSDLQKLVPGIISQGLMGYAFTCPDLIGGGDYASFLDGAKIDEEMVVRSAQVHALMPMMQFSVAPWRVLNPANQATCRKMALLHASQGETILALARNAAKTGEPIVRPLCWQWPDAGYESVKDQFMLGDDILVAPVVEAKARSRKVSFPVGDWLGDDGSLVKGPLVAEIKVPLERLPWYRRQAK